MHFPLFLISAEIMSTVIKVLYKYYGGDLSSINNEESLKSVIWMGGVDGLIHK